MDIYRKRAIVKAIMDGHTTYKELIAAGITDDDIAEGEDVIHDEDRILVWVNSRGWPDYPARIKHIDSDVFSLGEGGKNIQFMLEQEAALNAKWVADTKENKKICYIAIATLIVTIIGVVIQLS